MKIKLSKLVSIISLFSMLGVLFYLAANTTPAQAASNTLKIKVVTFVPKKHPFSKATRWMIERIEKATEGQVTFNWLGGPEVFAGFEQPKALKSGLIGAQFYLPGMYSSSIMPEIFAMPLSPYPSWEERKVGIYDLWEEIIAKKMNCKYLGRLENIMPGFYAYTVKKPIRKLDDFKGLTLRAAPFYTPIIKELGAAPITLSTVETITALQRGVIDGQLSACMGTHAIGYDEFLKYRIEPGFCQIDNVCLMNLDIWNKIPKPLQEVIENTAKDLEYMYTAQGMFANIDDWNMAKKNGMQSYSMDPDEANKFLDLVYNTLWKTVLKNSPEYGSKLKELMTKK